MRCCTFQCFFKSPHNLRLIFFLFFVWMSLYVDCVWVSETRVKFLLFRNSLILFNLYINLSIVGRFVYCYLLFFNLKTFITRFPSKYFSINFFLFIYLSDSVCDLSMKPFLIKIRFNSRVTNLKNRCKSVSIWVNFSPTCLRLCVRVGVKCEVCA